ARPNAPWREEMLAKNRTLTLIAAAIALAVSAPATPASAAPREDADAYEYYFPSSDGITMLHADVLRPKGLANDVKTPVILTASPYTNHAGGPPLSAPYDPLTISGPSPRFYDFLNLSGALTKGYTYVMVDLPGTGGSSGCNDWGGAREQAAVRAAVEWAASQSWSNGKVALLGKSYDGWTGLMGMAQQPEGLAAVVSLEPVYEGYRYMYMNGIRRPPYAATMGLFQVIDAIPGSAQDTPQYHVNGAPQVWCYPVNLAGNYADDDPHGLYWEERNLIPTTLGKTTPLFLTQGFLETNTHTDGAFQYFNGLAGSENRAWFGQFDHCRAWETSAACGSAGAGGGQRMAVGKADFIEEVMSFLDEHLKGIEPAVEYPTIEVQDTLGRYRAEEEWPPADSRLYQTSIRSGTYTDSGSGRGDRPAETQGIWTVSPTLSHDVWLSGEPFITVGVDAVPNSNLAANVYDVDEEGQLTMISRGVSLLRGTGTRTASFSMYGQDWPIPAGHRIAVLISSANTDIFTHVATRQTVTVRSAKIELPFLRYDRTQFLPSEGGTSKLDGYLGGSKTTLTAATISAAEKPFNLPGPLQPNPAEA
ncbi:MAG: CocE/NonD family hydrolase, partial [Actinomycetota bacterium]